MTVAAPSETVRVSKAALWTGRVISILLSLMLLGSAAAKFAGPEEVHKSMGELGWQEKHLLLLGILEASCTILYLIPQTSVLGAILLTGYLGGATATHIRVEQYAQPFVGAALLGVLAWLGLYLRDPRLRALVPLRST